MSISIILIAITSLLSFIGFNNERVLRQFMLFPIAMRHPLQSYRLLSSGFVHADTLHLAFNMITLYFFGPLLERSIGWDRFTMLYLSGIIVASLPSFYKQMDNPRYASLGASGGVAAVIFAFIYFYPWQNICLFFAICIPSIVFAILYLIYSATMARRKNQGINHDAHFWGSVYGLVYMILIDPSHGGGFLDRIREWPF